MRQLQLRFLCALRNFLFFRTANAIRGLQGFHQNRVYTLRSLLSGRHACWLRASAYRPLLPGGARSSRRVIPFPWPPLGVAQSSTCTSCRRWQYMHAARQHALSLARALRGCSSGARAARMTAHAHRPPSPIRAACAPERSRGWRRSAARSSSQATAPESSRPRTTSSKAVRCRARRTRASGASAGQTAGSIRAP